MEKLVLVDGSGYIFRAFYAIRALSRADGTPTNAVFGFCQMLSRVLDDHPQALVAVVLDPEGPSFRHRLYPAYKAHRKALPPELIPQFPLVHEAIRAYNLPLLVQANYEADDLIATYSRLGSQAGYETWIISSDKDMMQLITPSVKLYDPVKGRLLGPPEVLEKFGVAPAQVPEVQALAGDASDNVPGVPGIGIKTASQLIGTYGTLEALLDQAASLPRPKQREALTQGADLARLSLKLVTLATEAPIPVPLETLSRKEPVRERLMAFLAQNEFTRLKARYEEQWGATLTSAGDGNKDQAGHKAGDKNGETAAAATEVATGAAEHSEEQAPARAGKGTYTLITQAHQLESWVQRARARGILALDTETTGLDITRAQLVGLALATEPGEACYIPLAHRKPRAPGSPSQTSGQTPSEPPSQTPSEPPSQTPSEISPRPAQEPSLAKDLFDAPNETTPNETAPDETTDATEATGANETETPDGDLLPEQLSYQEVKELLGPLLRDASVLKVGHNIKYDLSILEAVGLELTPVEDTLLLSYVLNAGRHGHGLDELALRYFNHTMIPFSDLVVPESKVESKTESDSSPRAKPRTGSKNDGRVPRFDSVPLDRACAYAAEDADFCLRLYFYFRPLLWNARQFTVYETIERPLVSIIARMERKGVLLDPGVLRDLGERLQIRMRTLEQEAFTLADGHAFNLASPKQLAEILFDELGLEPVKKTSGGARSTDNFVLEHIAQTHEAEPPARLARTVLEWRASAKLKNTYVELLLGQVGPDGRVHTNFLMAGAQTGRLASTHPNLQNIPIRSKEGRVIRSAFLAPEGYVLVALDYSQIELRLLAEMAQIPEMRAAFAEKQDIHQRTASEIFRQPPDQITPELRARAKAINFGIIYGISAFGLARQLHCPRPMAQAYIDAYFERFPNIRTYMETQKELCRRRGYVETLFKRRVYLPDIQSHDSVRKRHAQRQAINAPVQGTAADVMKRAMGSVALLLAEQRFEAHLLLSVHDELIFEVLETQAEAFIETMTPVMEEAGKPELQSRLHVAGHYDRRWTQKTEKASDPGPQTEEP